MVREPCVPGPAGPASSGEALHGRTGTGHVLQPHRPRTRAPSPIPASPAQPWETGEAVYTCASALHSHRSARNGLPGGATHLAAAGSHGASQRDWGAGVGQGGTWWGPGEAWVLWMVVRATELWWAGGWRWEGWGGKIKVVLVPPPIPRTKKATVSLPPA